MDPHQTIVTTTLMAKTSVKAPKKARWEARSEAISPEVKKEFTEFPEFE